MGDRANIAIKQNDLQTKDGEPVHIYFYTHWSGEDLPMILQSALRRGEPRWNDTPYLSRIIFSEMIQDDVLDETGYGISTYICDNEHDIIYIDPESNTVSIGDRQWSFKDYVELPPDTFKNY